MSDPTIICPHCQSEIRLTESLAAPLIAATRVQFEKQLQQKDAFIAEREQAIRHREAQLAIAQKSLEAEVVREVEAKLSSERQRIIADESRRAKEASAAELTHKNRELTELQAILQQREQKLAEAQQAQAQLLRQQRQLDDARRELELTVEKRVSDGLAEVRTVARREAEDALKMKVMEKDQTILSMQQKIEELKQKAEQGSQQLQGEVQEIELEALLRSHFPLDAIDPVAKGETGGDVVQRVFSQGGLACGSILWESKRTKNWSDAWLAKLREDQRSAGAELAILVSQALPKGLETFDAIDGVWVTSARTLLPVATLLRHSLLQVSMARQVSEGQQSKAELLFQYLNSPRFRHRVEALVESFTAMQQDLDKERKLIMKQWAKRHEQIERMVGATVGMYGDLQGIAGKSLQEIEALELPALEDKAER